MHPASHRCSRTGSGSAGKYTGKIRRNSSPVIIEFLEDPQLLTRGIGVRGHKELPRQELPTTQPETSSTDNIQDLNKQKELRNSSSESGKKKTKQNEKQA